MLGAFCELYNAGLQERIDCYKKTGKTLTYNKQALQLKEVRSIDERLAKFSFKSEQDVLRRLEKTFRTFFARLKRGEKAGYPRYKSKTSFDSAAVRVGDGLIIKENKLRVIGIGGLIKVKWHRALPHGAEIGHTMITRKGGLWHICFSVKTNDEEVKDREFKPVGLDVGISSLVTLSTGESVENPKWTKASGAKRRRLQRSLARKKRFSRGWKKAKAANRRHHGKVVARRNDYLHKLSHRLVHEYSHIAIEALNIKGLSRGMLAKEVLSASWAKFFNMLWYKAESAGTIVEGVNPSGTSQTCSVCGSLVPKTLSVRWHACPHCGYAADRDVNAAQNILARASFMGPGVGLGALSKSDVKGMACARSYQLKLKTTHQPRQGFTDQQRTTNALQRHQ